MALKKQKLPIPVSRGINTIQDEVTVENGSFLQLEEFHSTKAGRLERVSSFSSSATLSKNSIVHNGNIYSWSGEEINQYYLSSGSWVSSVNFGIPYPPEITAAKYLWGNSRFISSFPINHSAVCVENDFLYVTARNTNNEGNHIIADKADISSLRVDGYNNGIAGISTYNNSSRFISVSGECFLLEAPVAGGIITYRSVDSVGSPSFSLPSNSPVTVSGNSIWDVIVLGDFIYVAYTSNVSHQLTIAKLNSDFTLNSAVNVSGVTCDSNISMQAVDDSGNFASSYLFVSTYDTTAGVVVLLGFDPDTLTSSSTYDYSDTVAANETILNTAIIVNDISTPNVDLLSTRRVVTTFDSVDYESDQIFVNDTPELSNQQLLSQPYQDPNDATITWLYTFTNLSDQECANLVSFCEGTPKSSHRLSVDVAKEGLLEHINKPAISGQCAFFAVPVKVSNDTFGINLYKNDHDTKSKPISVENTTFLDRGFTSPTSQVDEPYFFQSIPQIVASRQYTDGGGLLTTTSTYGFVVEFVSIDEKGQLRRSSTSVPVSVTLTGTNNKIDLLITHPNISDLCSINLYRTEANGSVYYFESTTLYSGDRSTSLSTLISFKADSSINDQATVYTQGGVLNNNLPGTSMLSEVYNERLFYVIPEEPTRVYYTKKKIPGIAYEPSQLLYFDCPDEGGSITALKQFQGRLLVFKSNQTYQTYGDGVNNIGAGTNFETPQLLIDGIGCTNKRSIIEANQDLYFSSTQGIMQLNSKLQVSNIGAPLDDYQDVAITSVFNDTEKRELYFLSNITTLIYNYLFNFWSISSIVTGTVLSKHRDTLFYIDSSGNLYSENANTILTDSLIKTNWIRVGGLAAWQRVYSLFMTIRVNSATAVSSDFTVKFYKNYSSTASSTVTLSVADYSEGVHTIRIRTPFQKCQAFQFEIENCPFDVLGFDFEIGIKETLARSASTRG